MAISEARRRANDKWDKENMEKVQFKMPRGYNEKIKKQADKKGLSKTAYVKKLIDNDIEREELQE